MSPWLLTALLIHNIDCQTYDSYQQNEWYGKQLNCTMNFVESCNIYCDEYQSCYDSIIHANTTSELSITCSEYWSCRSMDIYAHQTMTLTINCQYDGACSYINIYATNAATINFNPYTITKGVELYAQYASSINIHCNVYQACDSWDVYAKNAGSITITATANEAWYYSALYADNANYISITCASKRYEYACYVPSWYLPEGGANTNINCYGLGCQSQAKILTEYGVSSLLNIYINGCNECNNIGSQSCGQFQFLCNPSGSIGTNGYYVSSRYDNKDTLYAGSCGGDNLCSCSSIEESFVFANIREDVNCILSDSNTPTSPSHAPTSPTTPSIPNYPPTAPTAPTTPSPTSEPTVPTTMYYAGGVLYALLIVIISTVFIYFGYKDGKEDKIMKETWVHANNQRKQNKQDANYVYSDLPQSTPLPDGWRQTYTKDGNVYYQNDITQETRWKRPIIEEEEKKYDGTSIIEQELPLPNGWRTAYTKEGKLCYVNDITQETSWKRPKEIITKSGVDNVTDDNNE